MVDYRVFLDYVYDRIHYEIDTRDSLDPEFWDEFEKNLDIIVTDFDRDFLSSYKNNE